MPSPLTRTSPRDSGQALVLLLGVAAAAILGTLVLGAFGQALGAKGRHQRVADLAAMSAGAKMADVYPRLFEPPLLPTGAPNPRHLSGPEYIALARRTALEAGRRTACRSTRAPCASTAASRRRG